MHSTRSTSDQDHGAVFSPSNRVHVVVAPQGIVLALHSTVHEAAQVMPSLPQCPFEIYFLLAEQANLELTIGCDAESVACATEVLAHGRDEANLANMTIGLVPVVGEVG